MRSYIYNSRWIWCQYIKLVKSNYSAI